MTRDKGRSGRWSVEEHKMFLEGLERHGTDWNAISNLIKTRTPVQIRTHHQKIEQQRSKGKNYPEQVRLDACDLYWGEEGGGVNLDLADFFVFSMNPCFLFCSTVGPQSRSGQWIGTYVGFAIRTVVYTNDTGFRRSVFCTIFFDPRRAFTTHTAVALSGNHLTICGTPRVTNRSLTRNEGARRRCGSPSS